MMEPNIVRLTKAGHRQRGSVYILVLASSLLVATIGISSLMAARVQLRATSSARDKVKSRELARTAIDRGLWEVQNNALGWRGVLASGVLTNVSFGGGSFTLVASDLVDGNVLNNTTDPVLLFGVGDSGQARFMLYVMLNGDGTVQEGTWKRHVN